MLFPSLSNLVLAALLFCVYLCFVSFHFAASLLSFVAESSFLLDESSSPFMSRVAAESCLSLAVNFLSISVECLLGSWLSLRIGFALFSSLRVLCLLLSAVSFVWL